MPKIGKSVKNENRLVFSWICGWWWGWVKTANWYRVSFWSNENVLTLIMVTDVQFWIHQNLLNCAFKWVNFMVYELCLSKTVKNRGHPIKFEFQINNEWFLIYLFKYVLCLILILKKKFLFIQNVNSIELFVFKLGILYRIDTTSLNRKIRKSS